MKTLAGRGLKQSKETSVPVMTRKNWLLDAGTCFFRKDILTVMGALCILESILPLFLTNLLLRFIVMYPLNAHACRLAIPVLVEPHTYPLLQLLMFI